MRRSPSLRSDALATKHSGIFCGSWRVLASAIVQQHPNRARHRREWLSLREIRAGRKLCRARVGGTTNFGWRALGRGGRDTRSFVSKSIAEFRADRARKCGIIPTRSRARSLSFGSIIADDAAMFDCRDERESIMTTLVTGAGLIGTEFARHAIARGETVVFVDPEPRADFLRRKLGDKGFSLLRGDVRDLPALV